MRASEFVNALKQVKFEDVFNPYADRCLVHDVEDAPSRRARALVELLQAAVLTEVEALWIGRDLGHRGGRRTGLALTDDVHLTVHATRWKLSIERPTTGSMIAERTAAVIWRVLAAVPTTVFLWNVFPLHPHDAGNAFTNRPHRPNERAAGIAILSELIAMLRPHRVVAIGNDAAQVAAQLAGVSELVQVRHPSYGGQRDFIRQIKALYDLKAEDEQLKLL